MSIFSRIFGSKDVIKQAADGIYHGVDKAFYTSEEKAEGFLKLLKAYEPFKLAQRWLALVLTIPYVVVWVLAALMMVIGGFITPENTKDGIYFGTHLVESAKNLGAMNNDTLGFPVALILGFYFGGGAVEGVARSIVKKKSED